MTASSRAVFLSYASEDAGMAKRICDALRVAGVEIWFDQTELRGGDVWDQKIRQQVRDCALFVPIISRSTQSRTEGYFRLEWRLADQRTQLMGRNRPFLVPVCVDATAEKDADVPDSFSAVQWSRLPDGNPTADFVARIGGLLNHPSTPIAVSSTPILARAPGANVRQRWWLRVGVVVIASAAAVALYFSTGPHRERTSLSQPAAELRAPAASTAIPEKSVAVLPFTDMSEKHDQEYFGDGMAVEILALLGKLPGVRVVGLRSSSQFKAKTDDLRTIGAKLGVVYVVDGSIQRSAARIRVAAQLIDTRDGVQRWSDVYDQKLSDVVGVQDQIASSVAKVLQVGVGEEFGSRVTVRNTAAYDLYLRGLHALDKQSRSDCEEAAADFQRALEIDPKFAEASAGLATAYWIIGDQDWLPAREAFEHARQAAENAIRLNPKLGAAHAALAEVHLLHDWDWAAADSEANLALSLGAGVEGAKAAARVAATFGRWDRARQLIQSGLAIDPFDPMLHMNLAYLVDLRSGRFAEAAAEAKRTLDLSPEYATALYYRGLALLLQGRLDEALATMQLAKVDDSGPEGLAIVYFALGRKAESDAALQRAIAQDGETWPYGIATTLAFRHETDKAISWLERAYGQRDSSMYTIKGEPLFRSIENDSRYKAMLRKMHLPE